MFCLPWRRRRQEDTGGIGVKIIETKDDSSVTYHRRVFYHVEHIYRFSGCSKYTVTLNVRESGFNVIKNDGEVLYLFENDEDYVKMIDYINMMNKTQC